VAAVSGTPSAGEQIGEGEPVTEFTLTDSAIERALAPDVNVSAPTDFMTHVASAISVAPRPSTAWGFRGVRWPRVSALSTQLLLALLVLLVLIAGAFAVASLPHRPLANGHVLVARGPELLDIDPVSGLSTTLLSASGNLLSVTRSLDGSLVSFWTITDHGTTLEVVDSDGSNRRELATNLDPHPLGQGQIDVWSPDGRSLAAGVLVGSVARILVIDVASGMGEIVGPVSAGNPLWSPDGKLLAFSYAPISRSVLAVMRPDGSGVRVISGETSDLNISGTNNWSPDGAWIAVGAESNNFTRSNIYRANVDGGYLEQLTSDILSAAPALSPDGTLVAYSFWRGGRGTQDLNVMDADGANQRLVLAAAINYGWSNDSQFLLAEWRPPNAPFQLITIRPDGTDTTTLLTFEDRCEGACVSSVAWGQPRP
jgi:roadblock/LC7 domain-containing protein